MEREKGYLEKYYDGKLCYLSDIDGAIREADIQTRKGLVLVSQFLEDNKILKQFLQAQEEWSSNLKDCIKKIKHYSFIPSCSVIHEKIGDMDVYFCEKCGKRFKNITLEENGHPDMRFCQHCGAKLEWFVKDKEDA